MQVHPELTTALLAERERDLRTRAEQRRMAKRGRRRRRAERRLIEHDAPA